MGKKRIPDPGLNYLMDINFDRARGQHGLIGRWQVLFGKTKAGELWKKYLSVPEGTERFYEFKNSDPLISKSFTEANDGDIIRKACNYISSHKEYFGETILEIGCDGGYFTGFLARTFPESRIVAIDRDANAVEIAKSFTNSLGISNVEFRSCTLQDVEEQFDTVFSARTIRENIIRENTPFDGEPIQYQYKRLAEMTKEYTDELIKRVKGDGHLCIFEKVGRDPLLCGWMQQLNDSGYAMMEPTFEEFECEEANSKGTFQAFICRSGEVNDPEKIRELWLKALNVDPAGKDILEGWAALVYLDKNAGELIREIYICADGKKIGRFAAFYDKDDKSRIYYLSAVGGNGTMLRILSADQKEMALDYMEKTIRFNENKGKPFREYDPAIDSLEGI